jgi:hypothetical protein
MLSRNFLTLIAKKKTAQSLVMRGKRLNELITKPKGGFRKDEINQQQHPTLRSYW